jgi:polar amino acid transport system substrate-binding protein
VIGFVTICVSSWRGAHVRFGSKADMCGAQADVRFVPKVSNSARPMFYSRARAWSLVAPTSGRLATLDRPGVRVAGEANTTTFRSVARVLKLATIVAVPSVGEAIDMLRSGKVDAFALGRDALAPYQAEIPGSRILDGHFHRTGIAIAVPKNRPAALAHASAFLKEAKASGLVRRAFDKAGLQSTAVAPAE